MAWYGMVWYGMQRVKNRNFGYLDVLQLLSVRPRDICISAKAAEMWPLCCTCT